MLRDVLSNMLAMKLVTQHSAERMMRVTVAGITVRVLAGAVGCFGPL